MDCYIYYKSTPENTENIVNAVTRLNALLTPQLRTGIQLQRRPHLQEGQITWMEIYQNIPDHFDILLSQAIKGSDIKTFISSDRHIEYFQPIAISL